MMPTQMTLWHNPRCSKSRAALKLLQEAGHQPAVRRYLDAPPTADEIVAVRNALRTTADEMVRRGEKLFKDLDLGVASEADLIEAMAAHPILIERPILIHDGKAVIGRPPEQVFDIL